MLDDILRFAFFAVIGGAVGIAAALLFKSAARAAGCALGIALVLLEVAAYQGWIHVDFWGLMRHAGQEGEMAGTAMMRLWRLLTWNLPFGAGFGAGFIFGLRHR